MCHRNTDWLPLARPQMGTRPATQACAPTRHQTSDPSVCRLMLNSLSHTSQGTDFIFLKMECLGVSFTGSKTFKELSIVQSWDPTLL